MADKVLAKPDEKFSIEELDDRYRLHNVTYKGGLYTVDWSKALLDGGNAHTQDDWVARTRDEEFQLAPGPVYGATMLALHGNKDVGDSQQKNSVNRVRAMFKDDFGKYVLMTGTRVVWTPAGPDEVYHRYGYLDQSRIDKDLVGPDGYFRPGFEEYAEAMFGTRDIATLEHAVTLLTRKEPHVFRFNLRQGQRKGGVLRFGCVGIYFCIGSSVGIVGDWPARGVVVQAAASSGTGGAKNF